MVVKAVPNAKLVVAGANHHTKAGYWESVRAAQPAYLPVEFRGYVPEEAIPDLYQSTSVLVMPYDSATGSSGPAHQACEYGVPIVCADIADLREMAADEDMAVSFYQTGNASYLADQLITILQSPELQRRMAEHNYLAGVRMTMNCVVGNYLRWFELQRCKRTIRRTLAPSAYRPTGTRAFTTDDLRPDWPSAPSLLNDNRGQFEPRNTIDSADDGSSLALADSLVWEGADPSRGDVRSGHYPCGPTFESEC